MHKSVYEKYKTFTFNPEKVEKVMQTVFVGTRQASVTSLNSKHSDKPFSVFLACGELDIITIICNLLSICTSVRACVRQPHHLRAVSSRVVVRFTMMSRRSAYKTHNSVRIRLRDQRSKFCSLCYAHLIFQ